MGHLFVGVYLKIIKVTAFQCDHCSKILATEAGMIKHEASCGSTKIVRGPFEKQIEELYKKYPRKEGKSKGLEKLVKQVRTEKDLQLLQKQIENYAAKCMMEGTETKYIKQFSTFANCRDDYSETEREAQPFKQMTHEDNLKRLGLMDEDGNLI